MNFPSIPLKLEKVGPAFSSFNSYPSLPSVARDDRKKFQHLSIALLNNKTRPFCSGLNLGKKKV